MTRSKARTTAASNPADAKNRWPTPWGVGLAAVALGAVAFAMFRHIGPLLIDDSWISFRYAAHLAGGEGLVFNPGERVQGFTNPLYTLLLALGAAIGIGIPKMALALGFVGAVGTATALVAYRPGVVGFLAGTMAAFGLLLLPEFLLNSVSGMETSLFCALLAWSWVAWRHGRWLALGVLQGLLVITRPDAVFWMAPALGYLLWRDRPALRRVIGPLALIAGAWFAFAWIYYGSPAPHSIAAKRLIHAGEFGAILSTYLRYFGASPAFQVAWIGGLVSLGLVSPALIRRGAQRGESDSRGVFVFLVPAAALVLYLIGLSASGVQPFEVPRYFLWYAIPPIPVVLLLLTEGADRLAVRVGGQRGRVAALAMVAGFVVLSGWSHVRMERTELERIRSHFVHRESLYERTAAEIQRRAGGEVVDVLVGEVGVLGYYLLGHRVHDSAGINSPEILRLRRDDWDALAARGETRLPVLQGGTPRWVLRFLQAHEPEYVTSFRAYVHIYALENDETFRRQYKPIAEDTVWLGEGGFRNTLWERR